MSSLLSLSAILSFLHSFVQVSAITAWDIPFDWKTIPHWSFPGFSNHFLTESEIYNHNNSINNFSYVLLAAFNASCLYPNGTYYPATTTNWWYECSSIPGDISNMTTDLQMYANMEPSLGYQAKMLKETYLDSKQESVILAYIETINSQISYIADAKFNEEEHKSDWLYIENQGYINCLIPNASMDCDYQGPSRHQYDFRQEKVRKWFIDNVLHQMLFGNGYSQHLDGVFLDTISPWIEPYALCYDWNCTEKEFNDLWNASLQITEDALKYLSSVNKIGSVSARGDLFDNREWYLEYIQIVKKYRKNAVRYYEEICNTHTSTLYNSMITIQSELMHNITLQVHALPAVYNPDMVELAGYLIVAQPYTWFSTSVGGWGVNDSWWITEFEHDLGEPLEYGKCNYTFYGFDDVTKWKVLSNQTVFDLGRVTGGPGGNDSVYGVVYMGTFDGFDECRNEIEMYAKEYNFTSFTHFGQVYVDNEGNDWSNMCYGRIGVIINDDFESNNIGWFAYAMENVTSANIFDYECERNFEHLHVKMNPISFEAYLNWM